MSDIRLEDAGYFLVYPKGAVNKHLVTDFRNRIIEAAAGEPGHS